MNEEVVQYRVEGQRVSGVFCSPTDRAAPVVLLLHGFGGHRDELLIPSIGEGIFKYSARILAEAGYASLRIDFRGSGVSEGHFEDTTYSSQINDAIAALDLLRSKMAQILKNRPLFLE